MYKDTYRGNSEHWEQREDPENKEKILKTAREEEQQLTCKQVTIRMTTSQLQQWNLEDRAFLDSVRNLTDVRFFPV